MRDRDKLKQGWKRRKSGAAALILAVALTACGGEGDEASSGVVQLEDITRDIPGQAAAVGADDEVPGDDGAPGDNGGAGDNDVPGTSSLVQDVCDTAAAVGDSFGAAVSAHADIVPEATTEPFEEKLTPEGIGWGLGFGEPGTQPSGNASPQELALYDGYFLKPGDEKVIYLTFDCGYENGNTGKILDALKAHDAPATFFVVGHFLETEPELVRRMAEEGHAVGNHTYHHYDINTLDKESFQKELQDVEDKFNEITGKELSPYYRPPEGKCGITNLSIAKELGYATCFWSLAYVDWDTEKQPTHQAALDKLTSRIHPGAIVLLHNTSKTNGEILDELLTKWEEMGYTFAPLSELTGK